MRRLACPRWWPRTALGCVLAACGPVGGASSDGATAGSTGGATEPTGGSADSDALARLCEHAQACGCHDGDGDGLAACLLDWQTQAEMWQQLADQFGLVFDHVCYERIADNYETRLGCLTPYETDLLPGLCAPCSHVHGARQKGQSCTFPMGSGSWSDCDAHLECVGGKCVDRCEQLAEGETCATPEGERTGVCGPGLVCLAESTRTCAKLPGLGAACLGGYCEFEDCVAGYCADGLTCDASDFDDPVCAAPLAEGAACTDAYPCEWPLLCDPAGQVCVRLPEVGEACVHGLCADGLHCDDTDVCAAYVPLGTPCDSPLPCGPEATCTEGVCAPWKPLICYIAP